MTTWTSEFSGLAGQQVVVRIVLETGGAYSGELELSCPAPCTFLLSYGTVETGEMVIAHSYVIEEGSEDHTITVSLVDTSGVTIKEVSVSTT